MTPSVRATADAVRGRPKVSVVMPAWNAAATLYASMDSVLAQTHAELELLVIDDASTDATPEMVAEAASRDARVVSIRQPRNAGVAAARNAGLEAATGTPIGYAAYRRFDARGETLSVVCPPEEVRYPDMLKSNRIGNLTGIYDRAIGDGRFEKIGHEDYVFWLAMVRKAGIARRVPTDAPLADYLVRDGSLSADKRKAAKWQWAIYRDVEKLGRVRAAWYFAHYAANAVAKRR